MNDLTLGLRRPIDLATEPPFQLGRLQVTPALLQVSGAGAVEQLEPKVMQVLVLLHRARGEAISRAQLTEVCWGGVVVGDDSINRSISLVRRALRADPQVRLQTIPRVGYRLYVEGESAALAPAQRQSTRRFVWILAGAAIAALAAAAAAAYGLQDRALSVEGVRPLTRQAGFEGYPAATPDGARVAYASGLGFGAQRDILVRDIDVGAAQPVAAVSSPADEYAPAWSPDGRRLAFVRRDAQTCGLIVMAYPGGTERNVAACASASDGVAWLDENRIAFADRPQGGSRRLLTVDVADGALRPLTSPPAGIQGDDAPVISPDGRQLLFRRTASLGNDDLYVLNLRSGRERQLTKDGWKALGAVWSKNGRTIYFSSNRGGDFGLWAIKAKGGRPKRVSPGVLPLGRLSAAFDHGVLIAEAARSRAGLFTLSSGGLLSPTMAAAGSDWDPDLAADGALAFGSDRSGGNELWLKPSEGAPARLTRLQASFVHSPRFSPDGTTIAFIAVVGGRSDIHLVGRDGSRQRVLTSDGAGKGRAAWTPDGAALIFTARSSDGWRSWRIDRYGGSPRRLVQGDGVVVVQRSGSRLFARKEGEPTLYEMDPQTGALTAVAAPIALSSLEGWTVVGDGVLQFEPSQDGRVALVLDSWTGQRRRLAEVRPSPRMTIASTDGGAIVLPQQIEDDVDLIQLQIARR